MDAMPFQQIPRLQPHRQIYGMSAILLPLQAGEVDWHAFAQHFSRTRAAGLVPAVNMDTGYTQLISQTDRLKVLEIAQSLAEGTPFVAGAFVNDHPATPFDLKSYQLQCDAIQEHGGLPILFQSFGLVEQNEAAVLDSYRAIAKNTDRFLAFELGKPFAPFGTIYSESLFEELLDIKPCLGIKHSSLRRDLEWMRLSIKNRVRPDFLLLTGNDLAIDMAFYGCDYLLGLSTFAPDLFALRDRWWLEGDRGLCCSTTISSFLEPSPSDHPFQRTSTQPPCSSSCEAGSHPMSLFLGRSPDQNPTGQSC